MEIFIKVNGKMQKNTVKEYGFQPMVKLMKEIGRMIKETDLEFGMILKNSNMKVSIKMECNMVKEYGHHTMVKDMKDNGKNIKEMDLVYGLQVMENHMKEIGKTVNSMARVFIF